MTELLLNRELETTDATLGKLFFADQYSYYTVEDIQRRVKIPGVTAIPIGRYQIFMQFSPHFQREMPHLQNVPGYTGVLVHWGNDSADTDGCVIIGLDRTADGVAESRLAFDNFLPRLEQALLNGEVWLTIKSAFPITH